MSILRLSFAFLLLIATVVNAEQNVPINVPGGGAADLLNVTTPMDGQAENTGVVFTCTDAYGRPFHRGDTLFDECMKQKRGFSAPKASPTPAAVKN
jgi:hypothetical protein